KHLVWLAIAVLTGFAFAGYFTPVRDLTFQLVGGDLSFWQGFWLLFYSAATYGNAGWMREQVCLYMCPYARLQSAMLDRNSLVISYDPKRGEPRGGRSRQQDPKSLALGECIDCTLCAQVCPTGIDIRDGLQYQCIGCAACIDVCNQVMDKMNYPRGLIRYTTENALMGLPSQILRPRMMIYGFLLSALSVGLLAAVVLRVPLELDIIRDRNLLYVETVQGEIENVYTLKIINMDKAQHEYLLTIEGSDGIRVAQTDNIIVKAGEILEYPVRVSIPKKAISSRNQALHFRLQALDRPRLRVTEVGRFLAPNG
ncbi:MAG TPA: cytochrome c oxidase accessory protein CcoG, partial [Gammaproteobacteria bacterium]|nr:cytochrome c oxidase accessory protein CcoG [Gammaproteobacteria bacterium]